MTAAVGAAFPAVPAAAQATADEVMSQDLGTLRSDMQQRYDQALAVTLDPAVVSTNDTRYIWASEAKVQCGIAIGFLKSSTRDATSISKCVMASDMMNRSPVPPPPPVRTSTVPAEVCAQRVPGIVFFEFDSAVPPMEAQQTIQFVAQNAAPCGWSGFDVVGHADRAGSNAYNQGLSLQRANAVAELMSSLGIPRSALSVDARGEEQPRVPTEDGVRNPQNRRVEISVK